MRNGSEMPRPHKDCVIVSRNSRLYSKFNFKRMRTLIIVFQQQWPVASVGGWCCGLRLDDMFILVCCCVRGRHFYVSTWSGMVRSEEVVTGRRVNVDFLPIVLMVSNCVGKRKC